MAVIQTSTTKMRYLILVLILFSIMYIARSFVVRPSKLLVASSFKQFCSATPPQVATATITELSKLEIRVGKIVEIGKHPEAETLYVEKVL